MFRSTIAKVSQSGKIKAQGDATLQSFKNQATFISRLNPCGLIIKLHDKKIVKINQDSYQNIRLETLRKSIKNLSDYQETSFFPLYQTIF